MPDHFSLPSAERTNGLVSAILQARDRDRRSSLNQTVTYPSTKFLGPVRESVPRRVPVTTPRGLPQFSFLLRVIQLLDNISQINTLPPPPAQPAVDDDATPRSLFSSGERFLCVYAIITPPASSGRGPGFPRRWRLWRWRGWMDTSMCVCTTAPSFFFG